LERVFLGLDLGVNSIKAVVADCYLTILRRETEPVRGNLFEAVKTILQKSLSEWEEKEFVVSVTGNGKDSLEFPERVLKVNEITALACGVKKVFPEALSAFDIGAENARWLQLKPSKGKENNSFPEIVEFSMNERCAAGTGLFLEQQAFRLKLSIEEFSSLAAKAKKGARLAGRCSVFAKSDMIHLQQKGTPIEEIAYGACLALVRSITSSLLRGKESPFPIALAGGTVKNYGLLRAFRQVLKSGEKDLFYSEDSPFLPAIGAICLAQRNQHQLSSIPFKFLVSELKAVEQKKLSNLKPLCQPTFSGPTEPHSIINRPVKGYLGIDIGSVSTNLVIMDEDFQVLSGVYLPTRGQPLEALKDGFLELLKRFPAGLEILGTGTTGSGRYLAGKLVNADSIKNEITCQMKSSCFYFPEVDTIFEIGGQDSKYIQVQQGKVVDFNLNKICAAGTGSFLEEQAAQLKFSVENDFARLAFLSSNPYDLGSRCTVFMESELIRAASRNQPLPDLVAGLAYSIARNYLEKVVERRPVGNKIVFQGGVASNQAVVKAFSELLGKEILVHPYNRISGAIGAALEAREKVKKSGKKSLKTSEIKEKLVRPYNLNTFECHQCSNRCEVVAISSGGESIYFGDICERYTSRSGKELVETGFHHPLAFRNKLLEEITTQKNEQGLVIGLPRASTFVEFLPLWKTFFSRLGYRVKISPETNAEIMEAGIKLQLAETCLPIKIALGHIKFLQDDPEVDLIFFPSLIDSHHQEYDSFYFCPYTEHLPSMLPEIFRQKLLTLPVYLQPAEENIKENFKNLSRILKEPEEKIKEAWDAGWKTQTYFRQKLLEKGKEILAKSKEERKPILIVGSRPYLLYDAFLNLNLWSHLEKLGLIAIPYDYLPLEEIQLEESLIESSAIPPWRYPQHLLKAAIYSYNQTEAYPVFLTNYGCGLDGFSFKLIKNLVSQLPHLFLEFDEHRGEAGLVTRLEAFADEINQRQAETSKRFLIKKTSDPEFMPVEEIKKLPFIIPYFADQAIAFAGALKKSGLQAEVLPPPDENSLKLGERYSSGKECHAFSYLLGDLLKYVLEKKPAEKQVFFFPGARYACLLQQYGPAMRSLLEELGLSGTLVLTPTLDYFWKLIGLDGLKSLWQGLVAVDNLIKLSCQLRPYEINQGETDQTFIRSLEKIEKGLAEGQLEKALKEIRTELKKIKIRKKNRPVVGIAGDIYTRQNSFANNKLFYHLEALGAEVWPSPFLIDEIDFTFSREFYEKLATGNLKETLRYAGLNLLKDIKKQQVVRKMPFSDLKIKESGFEEIVKSTITYLNYNNNQTLFLNVARIIDFARKGADGIINVICFNCMLGTASAAISGRIKKDFGNIPLPTLIYGETESTNEDTKLEAFMEQVKARYRNLKRS
jgi:predicted CoA-substrate-specific enzyme activase